MNIIQELTDHLAEIKRHREAAIAAEYNHETEQLARETSILWEPFWPYLINKLSKPLQPLVIVPEANSAYSFIQANANPAYPSSGFTMQECFDSATTGAPAVLLRPEHGYIEHSGSSMARVPYHLFHFSKPTTFTHSGIWPHYIAIIITDGEQAYVIKASFDPARLKDLWVILSNSKGTSPDWDREYDQRKQDIDDFGSWLLSTHTADFYGDLADMMTFTPIHDWDIDGNPSILGGPTGATYDSFDEALLHAPAFAGDLSEPPPEENEPTSTGAPAYLRYPAIRRKLLEAAWAQLDDMPSNYWAWDLDDKLNVETSLRIIQTMELRTLDS